MFYWYTHADVTFGFKQPIEGDNCSVIWWVAPLQADSEHLQQLLVLTGVSCAIPSIRPNLPVYAKRRTWDKHSSKLKGMFLQGLWDSWGTFASGEVDTISFDHKRVAKGGSVLGMSSGKETLLSITDNRCCMCLHVDCGDMNCCCMWPCLLETYNTVYEILPSTQMIFEVPIFVMVHKSCGW